MCIQYDAVPQSQQDASSGCREPLLQPTCTLAFPLSQQRDSTGAPAIAQHLEAVHVGLSSTLPHLKYCRSKTASGVGKLYLLSWLYSPVPGVRKSGMPADTEMPAPHITTIFLALPSVVHVHRVSACA